MKRNAYFSGKHLHGQDHGMDGKSDARGGKRHLGQNIRPPEQIHQGQQNPDEIQPQRQLQKGNDHRYHRKIVLYT